MSLILMFQIAGTIVKVYLAPRFEPNKTGKDDGGRKMGKSAVVKDVRFRT
jgi:hypothetical protein